jgi:hypothetical protein
MARVCCKIRLGPKGRQLARLKIKNGVFIGFIAIKNIPNNRRKNCE